MIEKSLNQTNSGANPNFSIYDQVKLSESYFNKDMYNITNLQMLEVAPTKSFEKQKDNILKMAGQVSNENLIREVSPTDIHKQRHKVKTSEQVHRNIPQINRQFRKSRIKERQEVSNSQVFPDIQQQQKKSMFKAKSSTNAGKKMMKTDNNFYDQIPTIQAPGKGALIESRETEPLAGLTTMTGDENSGQNQLSSHISKN